MKLNMSFHARIPLKEACGMEKSILELLPVGRVEGLVVGSFDGLTTGTAIR
jgi:hypothetical protein